MSLYRKYRPQNWNELIGQEHICETLQNQIALQKISHAYLFSGPRGIGKTTTARLLAKALGCAGIDVLEIDAASHTGVDSVRDNIIETANFRPTQSKYKIFIIDEVHMLSTQAFNALLKTLEEPPQHVIFILATTEVQKLPATIVSRCEQYNFKRIGRQKMLKRLEWLSTQEGAKVESAVLERIQELSEGCMRDAESLLGQCIALCGKNVTLKEASKILPQTYSQSSAEFLALVLSDKQAELFKLIDILNEEGVNWPHFANALLRALRDSLMFKIKNNMDGLFIGVEKKDELASLLASCALKKLISLTDKMIERKAQINFSAVPQLPLELWVAENTNLETNSAPIQQETEPLKSAETHSDKVEQVQKKTNVALDEIVNMWQNCVGSICAEHPSLSFILKTSAVTDWDGKTLTLLFEYPFHKDKILEHKNKSIIEEALKEKFSINVVLGGAVKARDFGSVAADNTLHKLNAVLGGQVVE